MSCGTCGGTGVWPFVDVANAKPDAQITAADLHFALCLCAVGLDMRRTENGGRPCRPLWEVWCAREQVDPSRVARLEDVLSEAELRACGLSVGVPEVSRETALLNASKARRPRL